MSSTPVRLSITSSPRFLPVVRAAVEKMCEVLGFDSPTTGNVVLSADEALTNIIKHAYQGKPDHPIEIELVPLAEPDPGLEILMRDYGPTVDPARIKSRDLADIRPGGLGVHIMTQCMDRVEYSQASGGGTLLTMVKRLAGPKRRQETKP